MDLQVSGLMSAAAVVAAAALWLGVEVPGDVSVVGEVNAAGGLVGRTGDATGADAQTLLKLAHTNGIRRLLLPASSATGQQVAETARRRGKMYEGLQVVLVQSMAEVLGHFFGKESGTGGEG